MERRYGETLWRDVMERRYGETYIQWIIGFRHEVEFIQEKMNDGELRGEKEMN